MYLLVPKLQLGNPVREALASRNRTGSWSFQDGIPKLELGNEEKILKKKKVCNE